MTGFVVDDMERAIEAVGKLDQLDRAAVRHRFEQRFTTERMAMAYVAAYSALMTALDLPLAPSAGRLARDRSAYDSDAEAA